MACLCGNAAEMPLRCLLRKELKVVLITGERRKDRDSSCMANALGLITAASIYIASLLLANILTFDREASDVHEILYAIAVSFGFDFCVVQLWCGIVQAILIRRLRRRMIEKNEAPELNGCTGFLINRDIAISHVVLD